MKPTRSERAIAQLRSLIDAGVQQTAIARSFDPPVLPSYVNCLIRDKSDPTSRNISEKSVHKLENAIRKIKSKII